MKISTTFKIFPCEYDPEIPTDGEWLVNAEAKYSWEHFGADADGNRGEDRLERTDGDLAIFDEHGTDVTDVIRWSNRKLYAQIEAIADDQLDDKVSRRKIAA